jgi:replication factor A1
MSESYNGAKSVYRNIYNLWREIMVRKIEDIEVDKWVNLEAEVLELWNNEHTLIRQVGILKDTSGIVKFVSWEKSNLPLLEEGITYRLEGMPVSEFEGRLSVAMVSTTIITRISAQQTEIPTV